MQHFKTLSAYIDYLELKAARQTAMNANNNALRSYRVAIWAIIAAVLIPAITGWKELQELFCTLFELIL